MFKNISLKGLLFQVKKNFGIVSNIKPDIS